VSDLKKPKTILYIRGAKRKHIRRRLMFTRLIRPIRPSPKYPNNNFVNPPQAGG